MRVNRELRFQIFLFLLFFFFTIYWEILYSIEHVIVTRHFHVTRQRSRMFAKQKIRTGEE